MVGIIPFIRNTASDYHRLIYPLEHLGIETRIRPGFLPDGFKDCKVLIFSRFCPFDLGQILKYKHKYGFKIIVDMDDYWELPPFHPAERVWKEKNTTQKMLEAMMNADMVWTTNHDLALRCDRYNPNVEIIPTAFPFDEGQFNSNRIESEECRMMYAGGSSHFRDLWGIRSLFDKISPLKFQMQMAGYDEKQPEFWNKMEKVITANGKIKNYIRKNRLPLSSYMDCYSEADISIAPLEYNAFNTMKSNLKVLEAGCKNIPIITSKMPPYLEDKDAILMAETPKEWYTLSTRLIKDKVYRQEKGQQLGEYVRELYNLKDANFIRKQIFDYFIKS